MRRQRHISPGWILLGLGAAFITAGVLRGEPGMILQKANDKELRTVEDFEEAVRTANQSRDRTLWIQALTQSGRRVAAVIDLSENKGSEKK